MKSRAVHLGIRIDRVAEADAMEFAEDVFGVFVQYPDDAGRVEPLSGHSSIARTRPV